MNYLMENIERKPVHFDEGEGSKLVSSEGRRFLDFFCDVGTASLGYNSDEQKEVLWKMSRLGVPIHTPNLYGSNTRSRAAKRLCQANYMDKAFFCNSGAEAVEAAIKLARKYQIDKHRGDIWTYKGGFHGRTIATIAAGDGPNYHTFGFGPLPEGFAKFEDIAEVPKNALAVMLAPIFGNNDVRMYPDGWLAELRRWTEKNGILLIFDEVQTGSGRTGDHTYAKKIDVIPDIITLAKGVAMGAPVGVCLARGFVADAFKPGTHFSTFGGNPLSCSFVNGMLDWMDENLHRVDIKGKLMKGSLDAMGWPKNVRGEGMLIAFDIDHDGLEFAKRCFEKRLLIGAFRSGPGPVKITPPLNIDHEDLLRGLDIINEVHATWS